MNIHNKQEDPKFEDFETGVKLPFEPRIRCTVADLDAAWELCSLGLWPSGYFFAGTIDQVIDSSALTFRDGYLRLDIQLDKDLKVSSSDHQSIAPIQNELRDAITKLIQSQISPDLFMKDDLILRKGRSGNEIICELPLDLFGKRDPDLYSIEFFPQDTRITTLAEFKDQLELAMKITEIVLEFRQIQKGTDIHHRALFGPPVGAMQSQLKSGGEKGAGPEDEKKKASLRAEMVKAPTDPVKFDDIKGQPILIEQLRLVGDQVANPDIYQSWGAETPSGILLHGPAGTGKTMAARALAHELDLPVLSITSGQLASKWLGDLEKFTRYVFEIAREEAAKSPHGRVILFLDEVDALIPTRDEMTHEAVRKQLQEILTALDGFKSDGSVFVVAATNRVDLVDSAFRSRMSAEIEVGLPDISGRYEILKSMLQNRSQRAGRNLLGDCDFLTVARETDGLSGRDLKHIVNATVMEKARLASQHGAESVNLIETKDLLSALTKVKFKREPERKIGFGIDAEIARRTPERDTPRSMAA